MERFDRAAWKSMQQTMNESSKFVDMMHNVPWEDGLSKEIVAAVESYLAKSKDGQLGVTGEGSMLDNAQGKGSYCHTSTFICRTLTLTVLVTTIDALGCL